MSYWTIRDPKLRAIAKAEFEKQRGPIELPRFHTRERYAGAQWVKVEGDFIVDDRRRRYSCHPNKKLAKWSAVAGLPPSWLSLIKAEPINKRTIKVTGPRGTVAFFNDHAPTMRAEYERFANLENKLIKEQTQNVIE